MALPGMAASKIQDFQSLMSECLWQGKEPDEGGGFSFLFQDAELELEPDQRFTSQPQTPQTGCGTGGASAALGVQVLSQVGSKGRNLMWNLTFPPGIYRKEEVPSSCTGWGGGIIIFFGCTKQLLEQQFLVRSLLGGTLGRDPQEESSGGTLGGEAAKTIRGGRVDRGRLWGLSPPGFLRPAGGAESRAGLGFPTAGMWEAAGPWQHHFAD